MLARTLLAVLTASALVSATEQAHAQIRIGRPDGAGFPRSASSDQRPDQTRAASTLLGLSLTTSGTDRDTLGMLVSGVSRGSPADRAGIDVGSRVATLDDASLRIDPADVGDHEIQSRVQRKLALALRDLRPGDDVTLRIFSGGRYRVLAVRAEDASALVESDGAPADQRVDVSASMPAEPRPDLTGESGAAAPAPRSAPAASVATVLRALADAQAQLRRLEDVADSGPLLDSLMRAERDLLSAEHRLRSADAPRRARITESDNGAIGDSSGPAPVLAHPVDASSGVASSVARGAAAEGAAAGDVVANGSIAAGGTAGSGYMRRSSTRSRSATIPGNGGRGEMLGVPGLRVAPVSQGLTSYLGEGSERGLLVMQVDPSWSPIHVGDVILRVDDAPVDASALQAAADPQKQVSVDLLRRRRLLTVTLHSED